MTTLDTTVPYYPVLMILKKDYPHMKCSMGKEYRSIPFDESYIKDWVSLHVMLGQLASFEEGMKYFNETFLPHMDQVKKQFIFVVDEQGKLAGTSSVWDGTHFGDHRLRVHWVGVNPLHQRKGIAKVLLMETIHLYEQLHCKEDLYLTTQTNSYVAIAMYLQFGFTPYYGEMPIHFHANKNSFKEDNEKAWNIIFDNIKKVS